MPFDGSASGVTIFAASYAVLWLLVLLIGIIQLALLRHFGLLATRLQPILGTRSPSDPAVGDVLAELTLADDARNGVTVPPAGEEAWVLVVDQSCKACEPLLAEVGRSLSRVAFQTAIPIVLASGLEPDGAAELRQRYAIGSQALVVSDPDHEARRRWGVTKTPTVLVVSQNRKVVVSHAGIQPSGLAQMIETFASAPGEDRGHREVSR